MATVSHKEGDYTVSLTSVNDELYTFRYIPLEQTSFACMLIEDHIRIGVEDGSSIEAIQEELKDWATNISVEKGNRID